MADALSASFEVTDWTEVEFDAGPDRAKLTKASVQKKYSGDIDGTSVTEWVMAYSPDGTATFVGIERISGTVGGREGSLVLQHVGAFADGAATAELTVVSGTGKLDGVSGDGDFRADPSGTVNLRLTST
jgi:hypothetical protein